MDQSPLTRSQPLASLPPRSVPWSLHLSALFGGFHNQFGWLFFGFGMLSYWIFGANADLSGPFFTFTPVETAPGVILGVEGTSASNNDMPVFRIHFTYSARGRVVDGIAYASGYVPNQDARVTVEMLRWDPTVARPVGTRRALFPVATLLVAIFPLLGLAFLYSGVRAGLQAARLLRVGRLATGKLIGREATNTSINNRPVMKLTFEFAAHDGSTCQVVAKTHLPQVLEDDAEELLLYDPADPSTAVMLDSLAGSPHLGPDGEYEPRPMIGVIPLLIVPLLSIVGNTGYLLLRVTR